MTISNGMGHHSKECCPIYAFGDGAGWPAPLIAVI